MIWPFKRDPLDSNADLLVGAANTLGVGTFVPVLDEFQFIPQDDMGQKYWDLVVTIAGVFIALMGLRNLSLNTVQFLWAQIQDLSLKFKPVSFLQQNVHRKSLQTRRERHIAHQFIAVKQHHTDDLQEIITKSPDSFRFK